MAVPGLKHLDTSSQRVGRAALVTAGGFAVYAGLLFTQLPSLLPGYPSVFVAFVLWLVVPGWLPQRALVCGRSSAVLAARDTSIVERVVLAFLFSMALAAIPGLLALRLHWTLDTFALAYATVAALAGGVSLLWSPGDEPAEAEPPASERGVRFAVWPLWLLLAVPLLAMATSPWWAGDRIARDFDDTVYMGFVNEYTTGDGLDAAVPFQDLRPGQYGRMQLNVWLVGVALVADSADVEAIDLLHDYLPPIMTLLVVAAAFMLARGLSGSTRVALLASVFVLVYGALDLAPHEGYGRNIFLRIGEDKMVASYILLPAGLLLAARLVSAASVSNAIALLFAIAAVFVTHPMALIFLGIAAATLAVVHALSGRSTESLRTSALLIAPWVVVGIGLLASSRFGRERILLGDPFRRDFHVSEVLGGSIVANFHLILHPLMMAAVLVVVPLWFVSRRDLGRQVLLAAVAGALVFMFVPPVATLVADEVNEEAVWRLPWLIPVPIILAYAVHAGASWLAERWPRGWFAGGQLVVSPAYVLVAGVAAFTVAAFLLQEHYAFSDEGAFYNRTSGTALVPWTDGSIFLGGVERMFSSDWRPGEDEAMVLAYLKENAEPGSTVLLPASVSTRFFPGVLDGIRPVDYQGAPLANERKFLTAVFQRGFVKSDVLDDAIEKYDIDLVIVRKHTLADVALRAFAEASAEEFEVMRGDPGNALGRDIDGNSYAAWAFDPDRVEQVGGVRFTVPDDIDPAGPQLDVLLRVAPPRDLLRDESVRMAVSYFEPVEDGEELLSQDIFDIVMDVPMPSNAVEGEVIRWLRTVNTEFHAGDVYDILVWRIPVTEEETFPFDVWFIGLELSYASADLNLIDGSDYYVYETER